MAITEILVHVDESPAAEARIRAAVEVAAATKAHVSALLLVTEPCSRREMRTQREQHNK